MPQPYDFALSTARFDVYGLDLLRDIRREHGTNRQKASEPDPHARVTKIDSAAESGLDTKE